MQQILDGSSVDRNYTVFWLSTTGREKRCNSDGGKDIGQVSSMD